MKIFLNALITLLLLGLIVIFLLSNTANANNLHNQYYYNEAVSKVYNLIKYKN